MEDSAHSIDSSLREQVIEHLFLGELLKCLWIRGVTDIDVLRPEVDRAGCDLAVSANGVLRFIQLKASYIGAKTSRVDIHSSLESKPGACVIWIWFDPQTLQLGPFRWFGASAGEPNRKLGARIGRHTRGATKTERPNIRVLNKGQFDPIDGIDGVVEALFGAMQLHPAR